MKKLLFIINPIAGHRQAPLISKFIDSSGLSEGFQIETEFTTHRRHASELSARAAKENFYGVVAVGGDGTVNETARSLVGTSTALGIIPAGSGNGLARHLQLSSDPRQAIHNIMQGRISSVDTMEINGNLSLNVSGFGFDGYVAWLFDQSGKRGLGGYTRIALKEYFGYKSVEFKLMMDNIEIDRTAHMVVIANASQFGNAAVIAPQADLKDGLMDIIVVKRPSVLKMPGLFYRLFTGRLKSDENTTMYRAKTLQAVANRPVHLHIDGEPSEPLLKINCSINSLSLRVIT